MWTEDLQKKDSTKHKFNKPAASQKFEKQAIISCENNKLYQ